jgi:autotransporter-associated beta strand protein
VNIGGTASSEFSGSIIDGDEAVANAHYGSAGIASIVKVGAGRFTLSGTSDYHGSTSVNQGTLAAGANNAFSPNSAFVIAAGATLDLAGFTGAVRSISGAGTVLLGANSSLSAGAEFPVSTFDGNLSGTGSFTKTGANLLTFTNSSPFTGTLNMRGGSLRFTGSNGAAAASAVAIFPGGALQLDSRLGTGGNHSSGNRIPDATPVTLNGGLLQLIGGANTTTTESLGQLRVASGASTINVAAGSSGGSATLSFASLGARTAGATVDFSGNSLGSSSKIMLGGQAAGFVGGWATANINDFAKYSATQGVIPFAPGDYNTNTNISNLHLKIAAAVTTLGNSSHQTLTLDTTSNDVVIGQNPFTQLDVTRGGVLKIGGNSAFVAPTAGETPFITSSFGDLIFHVQLGDLTVLTRLGGDTSPSRAFSVTKSGAGNLTLAGGFSNTYTGKTYVNAGTLLLQKTGTNLAQAVPGNAEINGGTLRLGANNQIADSSIITLNAGTFTLGGFSEAIANVINNGGLFQSGSGVLTLTEGNFNGGTNVIGTLPAPVPASAGLRAAPPAAGGPAAAAILVDTTVETVRITLGDNSVQVNARLKTGAGGLVFKGGGRPSIDLVGASGTNLAGELQLNGDVSVDDAGTRASITGNGILDLNGARLITNNPDTALDITSQIKRGSFSKDGPGFLKISGTTTLTGRMTITGGTAQFGTPSALNSGTVSLSGGNMSLLFPLGSTHVGSASAEIELFNSGAIEADETAPDPQGKVLGRITLDRLTTTGTAAATLTVTSPHATTLEFNAAAINKKVTFDISSTLQFNGPVSGTTEAELVKNGGGTLVFGGATSNTFSGKTTVQGGFLELRKSAGVNAIGGNLEIKGGATVRLGNSEQIPDTASLLFTGVNATLDVGKFNETVGGITSSNAAGIIITSGGSIVANSITLIGNGKITFTSSSGTSAAIISSGHVAPAKSAQITNAMSLSAGSQLDLANNGLVVNYSTNGGGTPFSSIRAAIISAYNPATSGAHWNDVGITSSTARSDSATGVGYAEASNVISGTGTNRIFMSQLIDDAAVLIRYTLLGDATLDGKVDFADLVQLAQYYNITDGQRTWYTGDFTYDGKTDFADLVKLAQNYNGALAAAAAAIPGAHADLASDLAAAFTTVPEPSCGLVVLCGASLLVRRRKSRIRIRE